MDKQEVLTSSGCDESKCVSQGGWNHFSTDTRQSFRNSFTCYGDEGTFYPKMCADGFVPITVEDEPTLSSADWYGKEDANISVSYFTCCPPTLASDDETFKATRQCSNPTVVASDENTFTKDTACREEGSFKHPRPMKTNELRLIRFGPLAIFSESPDGIDSYLCCNYDDDDSRTTSSDFLDSTECVPYRNDVYNGFFPENRMGSVFETIPPITCDFPDNSYSVPRPSAASRYQCCKDGTPLPPYVQDSTFNISVYSSTVLFGISAVLSLIVVLGLLIPLIQSRDRSSGTPSQAGKNSRFSNYNVYLIYLAFLDLIWCTYGVIARVLYTNQVYLPNSDTIWVTMGIAYYAGNFWINAIILHEVFLLLKCYKNARRRKPPSLEHVNLQGLGIYAMVVVYGVLVALCFVPNEAIVSFYVVNSVLTGPPLLFVSALPFWIWWHGYLPPLSSRKAPSPGAPECQNAANATRQAVRDKALRDLAIYFFRIVFIFTGLYVPLSIFMFVVKPWRTWPGYVNEIILAIQPSLTFVFLLTKSDVRKYVTDLVTLSYLFGNGRVSEPFTMPTLFSNMFSSRNFNVDGSRSFSTRSSRNFSKKRSSLNFSMNSNAPDPNKDGSRNFSKQTHNDDICDNGTAKSRTNHRGSADNDNEATTDLENRDPVCNTKHGIYFSKSDKDRLSGTVLQTGDAVSIE